MMITVCRATCMGIPPPDSSHSVLDGASHSGNLACTKNCAEGLCYTMAHTWEAGLEWGPEVAEGLPRTWVRFWNPSPCYLICWQLAFVFCNPCWLHWCCNHPRHLWYAMQIRYCCTCSGGTWRQVAGLRMPQCS
jgi:hypothetical protein